MGSFIAGTAGVVGLMFFAPTLARFALSFGPPEYFAIAMPAAGALRVAGGSFWQGLLVLGIGLAAATVGMEQVTAVARYTSGMVQLPRASNWCRWPWAYSAWPRCCWWPSNPAACPRSRT